MVLSETGYGGDTSHGALKMEIFTAQAMQAQVPLA
jgi:hypothetical protein